MAGTVKKAKAPAKPRKAAVKKETVSKSTKPVTKSTKPVTKSKKTSMPPREEIEKLARAYWAQRGYQDGFAEQDWLRAEQELLRKAS